jgi:hypothetical protein
MMRCSADKTFNIGCLLAMLLLWTACERATIPPDNARTGYDYFPLQTGQYRIYDVYRIDYNFAAENDTLVYQQKELISGSYLNQEGDSTFILHKLSRFNPDMQWKLDSVKHIRRTSSQLIEMGNNKSVVKLVFPVGEGKSWDSNILTTAEADSFRMVNIHRPFSLGDSLLDQTLTVIKRNIADTIVRQDIKREVFALRSGPVYRIHKTLNYCATVDCIGQGIITSGVFEEMKLSGTGKE